MTTARSVRVVSAGAMGSVMGTAIVAVLASAACAGSSGASSGGASPSPSVSVGSSGSSVTVGDTDASALMAEIAAYSAVDAAPATASAPSRPKINRPAVDPSADSPNGKCLAANAPAPEYRVAAMAAAQQTLICYEYALKRAAPSPAHLEIMLDVDEDGRLRDAAVLSDDFADDTMRTCTVRKLRDNPRLPAPKTGCGVVSKLPLTFLRADGGV